MKQKKSCLNLIEILKEAIRAILQYRWQFKIKDRVMSILKDIDLDVSDEEAMESILEEGRKKVRSKRVMNAL